MGDTASTSPFFPWFLTTSAPGSLARFPHQAAASGARAEAAAARAVAEEANRSAEVAEKATREAREVRRNPLVAERAIGVGARAAVSFLHPWRSAYALFRRPSLFLFWQDAASKARAFENELAVAQRLLALQRDSAEEAQARAHLSSSPHFIFQGPARILSRCPTLSSFRFQNKITQLEGVGAALRDHLREVEAAAAEAATAAEVSVINPLILCS